MYTDHNSLLHNFGVILKFFVQNTVRDINLQPFSNECLFGEHPSVLLILLYIKKADFEENQA